MVISLEQRSRRWILRRLQRQERRRLKAYVQPQPQVITVAGLVDGYCDLLGPACNDAGRFGCRRNRPPIELVRT